MPTTTAYEFGDVVLVPMPFTDLSATKKRPAVVISSDAYHRSRPDVMVMAITSQVFGPPSFGETTVIRWKLAGLLKPSLIKPVIATLEGGLILRKLGRLAPPDRLMVKSALRAILG